MPTQKAAVSKASFSDFNNNFAKDPRRTYRIEFVKCEGQNKKIYDDDDNEIMILSLTTVEDQNLFIAVAGQTKDFELLELGNVVKELSNIEQQFQSMTISMGNLTQQQSISHQNNLKDRNDKFVVPIVKSVLSDSSESVGSDTDTESNQNNDEKSDKNETTNTNTNTNNQDNTQNSQNSQNSQNDKNDKNDKTDDKKEESFEDVQQDLFSDQIHATFGDLVDALGDSDANIIVEESQLRDNKVLVTFKLIPSDDIIIRRKTMFSDSNYDKWNECTSNFGMVCKKSALVVDDGTPEGGFLVAGTMASVKFNFDDCTPLRNTWTKIAKDIEKNPIVSSIIDLLLKSEKDNNVEVHVMDKLESECVVELKFEYGLN